MAVTRGYPWSVNMLWNVASFFSFSLFLSLLLFSYCFSDECDGKGKWRSRGQCVSFSLTRLQCDTLIFSHSEISNTAFSYTHARTTHTYTHFLFPISHSLYLRTTTPIPRGIGARREYSVYFEARRSRGERYGAEGASRKTAAASPLARGSRSPYALGFRAIISTIAIITTNAFARA